MHTKFDTVVALWLVDNVPARMVWGGRRWRIIDTPTPIRSEPSWLPPVVSHAPERLTGWRFAARPDEAGPSQVFDVYGSESGWKLRDVWD